MGNLRAEQRVDVNGRLVTRHVRNDGDKPVSRTSIPAPTVGSKAVITKARRPVYADIMTLIGSYKLGVKDWNTVRTHLVHLTDSELSEVRDAMNQLSGVFPSVNQNFMKTAVQNGHALNAARLAKAVCDDAEHAGFKDPNRTLGGVLLGAVEMKMLEEDDWSTPEGRNDPIKAKLLVTQAILEAKPDSFSESVRRSVLNTFTLNNYELGNLIEENPQRSMEIVQAITSRKTADAGTIRELMNHDVKSLMDGVL